MRKSSDLIIIALLVMLLSMRLWEWTHPPSTDGGLFTPGERWYPPEDHV